MPEVTGKSLRSSSYCNLLQRTPRNLWTGPRKAYPCCVAAWHMVWWLWNDGALSPPLIGLKQPQITPGKPIYLVIYRGPYYNAHGPPCTTSKPERKRLTPCRMNPLRFAGCFWVVLIWVFVRNKGRRTFLGMCFSTLSILIKPEKLCDSFAGEYDERGIPKKKWWISFESVLLKPYWEDSIQKSLDTCRIFYIYLIQF